MKKSRKSSCNNVSSRDSKLDKFTDKSSVQIDFENTLTNQRLFKSMIHASMMQNKKRKIRRSIGQGNSKNFMSENSSKSYSFASSGSSPGQGLLTNNLNKNFSRASQRRSLVKSRFGSKAQKSPRKDDKGEFSSEGELGEDTLQGAFLQSNGEVECSYEEEIFEEQGLLLAIDELNRNKSWGIFAPDSTGKVAWDMVGFLIIIYQSIVTPYRLCFDVPSTGGFRYFEFFMDCIFWLDILVNFNTGIYDKGIICMRRNKVIFSYLKSWFVMDALASFPYEYTIELAFGGDSESSLSQYSQAPQLLRMLKLVRFLRILRLLRVMKLKKFIYKLEEYMVTETLNTIMDILKLLILIFFISHVMACTFYYVGDYEKTSGPENFITRENLEHLQKYEQYIACLYFSFSTMTTVGYGDIKPVTNLEKCYCMLGMIIACAFTAYIIGSIGYIFNRSNIIVTEIKLKAFHTNQFLIYHGIPNDLRHKILSYLEYLAEYKHKNKLEENEVLAMLNDNLRKRVITFLNGKTILDSPIFTRTSPVSFSSPSRSHDRMTDFRSTLFSESFISEMTFMLTRKTFAVDDYVFEEGKHGGTMYFVTKGSMILWEAKSHTFIQEIFEGSTVGEGAFFTSKDSLNSLEKPRLCSCKSSNFTEALRITRAAVDRILEIYPSNKAAMKRALEGVACFVCEREGHYSLSCPKKWKILGNIRRNLQRLSTMNYT